MAKKISFKVCLLSYAFQLLAGGILLMAALPKIIGAPEALSVFSQLEIESTRLIIGSLEIAAATLLILNFRPQYGALLGFAVMIGALLAHASVLGVQVDGDSGLMFGFLFSVLISCLIVMWIHRHKLPLVGNTF